MPGGDGVRISWVARCGTGGSSQSAEDHAMNLAQELLLIIAAAMLACWQS